MFSSEDIDNFIRTARYFAALFRLSFRHPEKMHYEDWERELVVEYIEQSFKITRDGIEKGEFSMKYWKSAVESLDRIQKWNKQRKHAYL